MENFNEMNSIVPCISPSAFIAKGAVVMGNVNLEDKVSIWYNSTIRSLADPIHIGEGSNVQDNAVIHVDKNYPVTLGKYVTIGHGAIIHGCQIGDYTLIGMGAVVLNGAKIGKNCIIAAGALVKQDDIIPDRSLVIGCPGKIIRQISEEDSRSNLENALHYIEEASLYKKLEMAQSPVKE